MTEFSQQKILPYARQDVYNVVADIEKYPQFLPWCVGLRVTDRSGPVVKADLMVGFRSFRETFTSCVWFDEPHGIKVSYLDGPFRYLRNSWVFTDHPEGTLIEFHIDFEFRSRALQALIGKMFDLAVHRMVGAFEDRAHDLYRE